MANTARTATPPWLGRSLCAALSGVLLASGAHAQQSASCAGVQSPPICTTVPCSETHTIAASDQGVPVEFSFAIQNGGSYEVTLTDVGAQAQPPLTPAPLAAVKLALTSGTSLVGTPLTQPGTMTFNASPGTYVVHVTGKPGKDASGNDLVSGTVGVTIASSDGMTQVASCSRTIAPPSGTSVPATEAIVLDPLSIASAATYTVTLTDLNLPQALPTLELAVADQTTGTLVAGSTLSSSGAGSYSASVTLNASDSYVLFAVAQASNTTPGGLFSISVAPSGGGAAIYSKTFPVGNVTQVGSALVLNPASYTLALTDLQLPRDSSGAGSPLVQVDAVVTQNGMAVAGPLMGGGTKSFTVATSGTYEVFASATAGANGGSYAVTIQAGGGAAVLSVARAVPAPGATLLAFSYDTNLANSGTYSLELTDFQFPAAFTAISAVAVQNGLTLGPVLAATGSQNVSASAGPLSLLVFPTVGSNSGLAGGLFGIDLTEAADGSTAFSSTQPVGQLIATRQLSVTTAGSYAVSVGDLGFPEPFANGGQLAAIVTTGATTVGSILGGGSFNFSATPGQYVISLLAEPQPSSPSSPTDEAGTYTLSIAAAPPAPTVSLTSDAASVPSGGTAHLVWSSQNATACTASGGWSGSEPLSGTTMTGAITASTKYTLTCSGAGGSAAQSVTIDVQAPAKGGGGAFDLETLMTLSGLLLWRARPRSRRRRRKQAADVSRDSVSHCPAPGLSHARHRT